MKPTILTVFLHLFLDMSKQYMVNSFAVAYAFNNFLEYCAVVSKFFIIVQYIKICVDHISFISCSKGFVNHCAVETNWSLKHITTLCSFEKFFERFKVFLFSKIVKVTAYHTLTRVI